MNDSAIHWLQEESEFLYRAAREVAESSPKFAIEMQLRAAALSFAARVLMCVEPSF